MNAVRLLPPTKPVRATIPLASSKSESNRALLIDALTGFRCDLQNLSTARDTQTMIRLLKSDARGAGPFTADVLDAGTTMRFLTAYFAIRGPAVTGQPKIMTGTPRMCERPIGILVDALRTLGADITYLNHDGYPPLQLNGFTYSRTHHVAVRGDVSSQYISALLLIAPALPNGLVLNLTGTIGSRPYIGMTIEQMRHFGAHVYEQWERSEINVLPVGYTPKPYRIESDWSGASYWYSVVALAPDETPTGGDAGTAPGVVPVRRSGQSDRPERFQPTEIELLGLNRKSLQGDSAIVDIMRPLGVESTFTQAGVRLTKRPAESALAWDFSHCPDLAQTVAVCAAAKGVSLTLTGIESLKIKETDRVAALQAELRKIGAELVEIEPNHRYEVRQRANDIPAVPRIATYDDHRMAMAFAPVAMQREIVIEEPGVVAKSYPSFWDDMARVVTVEPLIEGTKTVV